MILRNYHVHTNCCDGSNTVEQMAQAAIGQGMKSLGFSGHATIPFDLRYCTQPDGWTSYIQQVQECQKKYADKIEIFLGVEDDYYAVRPDFPRDYTIGATHYMEYNGEIYFVDETKENLQKAIREGFGNDPYKMTSYYFSIVADIPAKTHCDFIAHFDLVTKFNEDGSMFDQEDPRYLQPALEVLEALCQKDAVFEINTGAISRGYRTKPYPSQTLLRAIYDFGGAIVLNCDSHCTEHICSYLPEAVQLAEACGFRTHRVLTSTGWQEVPLGE